MSPGRTPSGLIGVSASTSVVKVPSTPKRASAVAVVNSFVFEASTRGVDGFYEIGALRALDLLAVNKTVNQFDVYVGTSAGSFVAALAANGVTPEEMMRVVNRQVPTPFRDIDRSTLMRPNTREFAQALALMPLRMLGMARTV